MKSDSRYKLVIAHAGSFQRFELKEGRNLLGRAKSCDVVFVADGISRKHLAITLSEGRLKVKDLGSANGTFMDLNRIPIDSELDWPTFLQLKIGQDIVLSIEEQVELASATSKKFSTQTDLDQLNRQQKVKEPRISARKNSKDNKFIVPIVAIALVVLVALTTRSYHSTGDNTSMTIAMVSDDVKVRSSGPRCTSLNEISFCELLSIEDKEKEGAVLDMSSVYLFLGAESAKRRIASKEWGPKIKDSDVFMLDFVRHVFDPKFRNKFGQLGLTAAKVSYIGSKGEPIKTFELAGTAYEKISQKDILAALNLAKEGNPTFLKDLVRVNAKEYGSLERL